MRPLISIITISYNAENTIEQTILSVINQTYPNIEYIIIDGGSTDDTTNIIKKYANRLAYWISESDDGIYDAMNKGIKKATGEWINFMNAGDRFFCNETILNIFNKNIDQKINAIYGKTVYERYGNYYYYKFEDTNIASISKAKPFCHQSSFVRTQVQKQHPFCTTLKICSDHLFFYKLYKEDINQLKRIDEIVAIFDATGISNQNNKLACFIESSIINRSLYSKSFMKSLMTIYLTFITENIKLWLKKIIPSFILKRRLNKFKVK